MESQLFWIVALLVLAGVAAVSYSLGTRRRSAIIDDCYVSEFWFFGDYVECKGGKSCPDGKCKLQYRSEGMSHWADADATSLRKVDTTSYRCVCG